MTAGVDALGVLTPRPSRHRLANGIRIGWCCSFHSTAKVWESFLGTPKQSRGTRSRQDYSLCYCRPLSGDTPAVRRPGISNALAVVLKKHRQKAGLSQEKLAAKAELHPTYIGLIERSVRNPNLNAAEAMAVALRVTLSALIGEAEALRKSRRQAARDRGLSL